MLKNRNAFKTMTYVLNCAFAAGLIMFICMAAGELFVNPQMFRGFLSKPKIWFLIFLESAAWMIPMALLSLPFIWGLKKFKERGAKSIVVCGWAVLGVAAIVVYKTMYFPDEWAFDQITRADITFGWTIPCVMILIANGILSLRYLKFVHDKSVEQ